MIHNFTKISFKEHLTLLPLPVSVLQQPTLPLDVSVQQEPVHASSGHICSTAAFAAWICLYCKHFKSPGIDSQSSGINSVPFVLPARPGYIGWRNRFLGIDSWTP